MLEWRTPVTGSGSGGMGDMARAPAALAPGYDASIFRAVLKVHGTKEK